MSRQREKSHDQWVGVAEAADVPDGTVISAEAAGVALAVFNVDGVLYATERWCPHRAGDLTEATIVEGAVACAEHWWRFDLVTGECRTAASRPLDRYPVRIAGGRIEVLMSPASGTK